MKFTFKRICLLAALMMVSFVSGCSGINASSSVSPASFFLPGLLGSNSGENLPAQVESAQQLAQAAQ